jgi:purine nucleoside permease
MRSHFIAALQLLSVASASLVPATKIEERAIEYVVKPKVFIISMFDPEAEIWWNIPEFDLLALNITVPGFSPLW